MKNLKILSLLLIIFSGVFFVSCEKDVGVELQIKSDVVFGANNIQMSLKSNEFDVQCTGEDAVVAEIIIDGFTEPFTPSVFDNNGELLTQAIKLNSGVYTVTSFKLLDTQGNVVMATPADGSEYGIYVSETVPFELVVPEFDKVEVTVDVLCFNEADYTSFGFNWFNIGQVEVNQLLFFGDLCYDPANYEGSLYDNVFDLSSYPFDIIALFEIRTFVDNNGQWESLKTFSNVGNPNAPLAAEWFTHSSGVVDFKFELWVYVQTDVNTWDYILFDTWEFDSNNPLTADSNNIVDFVIGDCVYGGTPPQFQYEPNVLPEPVQGPIVMDGNEPCKEKLAQARWRNFKTNNNGWDMAVGSELTGDPSTFTDLDWTSGYLLNGTEMPVTLSYDGTDLTITVDIDGTVKTITHTIGTMTDADIMEIMVRGSANQTVQLINPTLNGDLLSGVDTPQTGSTAYWTVTGVDYTQPWDLTGNLVITGESTSQEGAKVDVTIGKVVPCP